MSELESPQGPASSKPGGTVPSAVMPHQSAPANGSNCPTCGGDVGSALPPSYIYAIGRIEPRYPRLSVEKEFAQATGRTQTNGLTDRQALHQVLTRRENRYLARQL
jgi:PatG Domain